MKSIKSVKDDILTLNSLKTVVESYEEISAMRMRRVKKSVLQNRDFLDGLNEVYSVVEYSYAESVRKQKTGPLGFTMTKHVMQNSLQHNGKTVSIVLSANTGLYGDIIRKTFNLFLEESVKSPTDIVVIGRLGRKYYEELLNKAPYTYFDLSDSGTDTEHIQAIVKFVLQYQNIIVYHGLFKNILLQEPVKTQVTGEASSYATDKRGTAIARTTRFIFEPSVDVIAKFFESQLLGAIFEQTVNESSLSKFASRMVSLDFASDNIGHRLATAVFNSKKLKHIKMNSSQVNTLTGISLWR